MYRASQRQVASIAALVAIILLISWLGYQGFTEYYVLNPTETHKTPLDRAYQTWQLYTLESGSVDGAVPLKLEFARVLAPIAAAAAIVQVLLLFLGEQANRLWIRMLSGHTIVCGLSDAGLHVAGSARAAGRTVVVVDHDADPALRDKWKEQGGWFLDVDATEPSALRRAGIRRARALVAVHGDEGENVSTALAAERAFEPVSAWRQANPLPCHIQIVDVELASLFKASPVFVRADGPLDLNVFNAYDAAARITSQHHPLDREPIGEDDPRSSHLIVLGLGRMGLGLALQYAKVAHFANGRPLRITVFDRDADRRADMTRAKHPALGDVCDLRFVTAEFDDPRAMERLREIASQDGQIVTLAVCIRGDSKALACALSAHAALDGLDLPMLVRMATQDGLAALLRAHTTGVRLIPFGTLEEVNHWSALDDEVLDKQAREVQRLYTEKRIADGMPPGPADAEWRKLEPLLQDSCRQQADHIPVKLRAVGCEIAALNGQPPRGFTFSPEETELLARMEHARWVAERRLAGWQSGPKVPGRKTTPYLIGYDQLEEVIKDYDRDTVRNLPRLVGMAGGYIRRITGDNATIDEAQA